MQLYRCTHMLVATHMHVLRMYHTLSTVCFNPNSTQILIQIPYVFRLNSIQIEDPNSLGFASKSLPGPRYRTGRRGGRILCIQCASTVPPPRSSNYGTGTVLLPTDLDLDVPINRLRSNPKLFGLIWINLV